MTIATTQVQGWLVVRRLLNCRTLTWFIDEVPDDGSGVLEFSIPEVDRDRFFPLNITFSSSHLFSGLEVLAVGNLATGEQTEFGSSSQLIVEEYQIG